MQFQQRQRVSCLLHHMQSCLKLQNDLRFAAHLNVTQHTKKNIPGQRGSHLTLCQQVALNNFNTVFTQGVSKIIQLSELHIKSMYGHEETGLFVG